MTGYSGQHMFDDVHDAQELIGLAIGAGSMCWENVSTAGVFDSTTAAKIADAAFQRLQAILADRFSNRSSDGLHGPSWEWDGPHTAVHCVCGFYCIAENFGVAEREYVNHLAGGGDNHA